jgi:hypothetical protein
MTPASMSPSATPESSGLPAAEVAGLQPALAWPTETEIYILPDGRVIIADLPAELAAAAAALGAVEACEIEPDAEPHSPV